MAALKAISYIGSQTALGGSIARTADNMLYSYDKAQQLTNNINQEINKPIANIDIKTARQNMENKKEK